ncbi:SANT/Myb_domain [Hexamita inflata]|uniref:SANT/Myb domain n=1 Tax=Hexamita inflata TaxID=28002 RepID=A0AA86UYI6_9EUKA|nr:SANT/Myb domain [Hexamita inflata]
MQCNDYFISHTSFLFPSRSKRAWTQDEQTKFKHLFKQYKKAFKLYVPHFDQRSECQIKSFYQNVVHKNKMIQMCKNDLANLSLMDLTQIQSRNISSQLNEIYEFQQELSLIAFDTVNEI